MANPQISPSGPSAATGCIFQLSPKKPKATRVKHSPFAKAQKRGRVSLAVDDFGAALFEGSGRPHGRGRPRERECNMCFESEGTRNIGEHLRERAPA